MKIVYNPVHGENAIELDRTNDFLSAAKLMGEFINTLDLPADQHNRLVELAVLQTLAAEQSGFYEGLKMGAEFGAAKADR